MASLELSAGAVTKRTPFRVEGEVIGGGRGFEGGVDENLALGIDFEDGATAVADEEIALDVKTAPVATPMPSA